jgi:hypothetical protein
VQVQQAALQTERDCSHCHHEIYDVIGSNVQSMDKRLKVSLERDVRNENFGSRYANATLQIPMSTVK